MSFSFMETKAGTAGVFYAQGAVTYDGLSALQIEGWAFHLELVILQIHFPVMLLLLWLSTTFIFPSKQRAPIIK